MMPGFTWSDTVRGENPGHVHPAATRLQSRAQADEQPEDMIGAL